MKSIKILTNNSDVFGTLTCWACLAHCIFTPLILFSLPLLNAKLLMYYSWWSNLDYIFLIISFFMVYFSVQTTRIKRMKLFFWLSWFFLFLVIINEKTELFEFSEYLAYLATTGLSLLHLFNLKYCK